MKTKLIIFTLLLASTYANAFTIHLEGGTRKNKFNKVVLNDKKCECLGSGNITCPIDFATISGVSRTIWYSSDEIIDFVYAQIKIGNTSGSITYKNDLPLKWELKDKEFLRIDLEETGIKGLEKR